ncbi:hypothetical protein D3C84_1144670 [compost metagenome]
MPLTFSAANRFFPAVSKKCKAAWSSNEGELATSTTTSALFNASSNPAPLMTLTPVLGDAARVSCPSACRFLHSWLPIRPVPPMTTIFMVGCPLR